MKNNASFSWKELSKLLRKSAAFMVLMFLVFSQFPTRFIAYASAPGSVVMNEVGWAGSADSSTDEWIELYNTLNQPVDLTNWTINDDNGSSLYTISSGTIPAHGYFLIEDHETAVSTVTADALIDLSLANTGDSLELFDQGGQSMDVVNSGGGAWAAGSSASKATMERVDSAASGDLAANWQTSTGNGDEASNGAMIIGTPKKANTSAQNPGQPGQPSQNIEIVLSSSTPKVGDTLTATIKANNVQDLFAYGFDLTYDAAVLDYQSAASAGFLSANGTVNTSFQTALENNTEGKVVVAEARTNAIKTGINGSGNLLTLQFQVIGLGAGPSNLHFGAGSFLVNSLGDMAAQLNDKNFTVQPNQLVAPTNFQAALGQQRYALQLSWGAVPGATAYRVYRKNTAGQWSLLQEIETTQFVDLDGVNNGGFIIPLQQYFYRVTALNGQNEGLPAELNSQETRGLKGDNNRTDRVDGRDLEKLARHFGQVLADADFDALVDTTYDGQINGSDLIDIGADFAKTYTS